MARPSVKPKILQAAARLITEEGGDTLTLERVAERAGISKGGLLYHFPSKEALMSGLLEHLVEAIESEEAKAKQEYAHESAENDPFVVVLARLRAAHFFRDQKHFNHALLTAGVKHQSLIEKVKPKLIEKLQRISKDPEALILFLAVEGLFFLETLKLANEEDFKAAFQEDPLEMLIQKALSKLNPEANP